MIVEDPIDLSFRKTLIEYTSMLRAQKVEPRPLRGW